MRVNMTTDCLRKDTIGAHWQIALAFSGYF